MACELNRFHDYAVSKRLSDAQIRATAAGILVSQGLNWDLADILRLPGPSSLETTYPRSESDDEGDEEGPRELQASPRRSPVATFVDDEVEEALSAIPENLVLPGEVAESVSLPASSVPELEGNETYAQRMERIKQVLSLDETSSSSSSS